MRARCPRCGHEMEASRTAEQITCEECERQFSPVADAETLTHAPTAAEGEKRSGPSLRVYCEECGGEFTIPLGQPEARCPHCEALFTVAEAEQTLKTGPQDVRTARTQVTERPKEARPGRTDEAGMRWMRDHFEDYEILDFVSRGGMGAIYRARQKNPPREVALKVMLAGTFSSPSHRKRFEREAQAVAQLKHPAVVPVYEYGEVAGQPYFSMEFVEGEDLRAYARRNGLSRQQICRLMVRVCDAIQYAHEHGVIHRDLKPGNIMVDSFGRPRILDFGLSRASLEGEEQMTVLTKSGDVLGTPRYMSPEQAMGRTREIDERSDIYSLGVVLYELIVGVLPYPIENVTPLRALEVLRTARPLPPSALHSDLPRDLEIILLKAVSKDKEQRYESAEALAQDLERWLAGRPIAARPATIGYRLNRWAWRNRHVVTPVVILSVVILVLSGVFWNRISEVGGRLRELLQFFEAQESRAEEARHEVLRLIQGGNWRRAAIRAEHAVEDFPRFDFVKELPDRVRREAAVAVQRSRAEVNVLLRQARFGRARQRAEQMAEELSRLPYPGLLEAAETLDESFAERAGEALREMVEKAYDRSTALEGVDQFLREMPEGEAAAEARELREWAQAQGVTHYMRQHRKAFEAALQTCDWQRAGEIIESLRQLVGEAGAPGQWQEEPARMEQALARRIRPGTAARLVEDQRLAIPEQAAQGPRFVKGVAFGPRGFLLAAGAQNGALALWDLREGMLIRATDIGEAVRSVAISSGADLLAVGLGDGSVQVQSLSDGSVVQSWQPHSRRVEWLEFSPNGTILLSADNQSVALKNPRTGGEVGSDRISGRGPAALWHGRPGVAVSTEDGPVQLWDLAGGYAVKEFPISDPRLLALSPDQRLLVSIGRDETARVWEVSSAALLATARPGERHVEAVAFSPGGRLVATAGADRLVTVWEASSGKVLARLKGHEHRVMALAFDAECRRLASGSNDGTVRLWAPAGD